MTSRPEELVLTSLQALLDSWWEDSYDEAIEKCNFLLKKKTALDSSLTSSVQRILLQCWLEQKEYAKVTSWVEQHSSQMSDLGHYANYRMEDYEMVTKQASKESVLEQHLLAQSHYHLKQVNPALKVYQELLNDDDNDSETRMELLNNALAVIAANAAVPFVPLTDGNHEILIEKAEGFLQTHPEYHDLAFNLGTLQSLTGTYDDNQTSWLEEAQANCDDEDDMPIIEHNIVWSRQFWQNDLAGVDYSGIDSGSTSPTSMVANINQTLLDDNGKLPSHPNAKWNTLQVRMYWYNRAIIQFKADELVECQESCQSLKRTLGGESSNKKKKADTTKGSSADLWWESRVDVLLAYVQDKQSKSAPAIERLEQRIKSLQQQPQSHTIDHAIAHTALHLYSIQNSSAKAEASKTISFLKSLPASIRSQPAVKATLEELGANDDNGNRSTSTKMKKSPAEQADMLFVQGNYEKAVSLYSNNLQDILDSDEDQLAQHLRRVQALAMIGKHDESTELWSSIQAHLVGNFEPSTRMNGETLEKQALPRSSTTKTMLGGAAGEASFKALRSEKSVLNQRARKREAYLKNLEAKGQYNPDRATKPNPERWIPKHARRSNRRGGRRGGPSRSAQGGGSQADAQRLDAAARRAGTVTSSATPSTANMKVSNGSQKVGRRR
jgi:tetratricopeptide (TPR) repeat protein